MNKQMYSGAEILLKSLLKEGVEEVFGYPGGVVLPLYDALYMQNDIKHYNELKQLDYKVIIVGDAAMAPEELYSDTGNYRGPNGGLSGYEWLKLVKHKYKKSVWLNPNMAPGRAPWREAETAIKEMFPMYKLTVDGLNQAMIKLMTNKN